MTDQHADDSPALAEDDRSLHENNSLHVTHSNVQRTINFAALKYQESYMRWLSDEIIRNTIETLLKTAAKEARKSIFSPVNKAVDDIVKQAVNRSAENNVISSKRDRITKSSAVLYKKL